MQRDGTVKTVEILISDDDAYDLCLNKEEDYAQVHSQETGAFLAQFPAQALPDISGGHHFMIFVSSEFPFDSLHLRRAFSAGLDRVYLVREVFGGGLIPMKHLAPPSIFGAPPLNEVGVGYDPEFAQSELELAGYPNCEGLPTINFVSASGLIRTSVNAEEFVRSWEDSLGCPEGTIKYQGNYYADDDVNTHDVDMLSVGWIADYPDQEYWVGTILYCDSESWIQENINRSCTEIDQLIVQAREEISQSDRIEQYRQIEEHFFGYEGTFPIAPMFAPAIYTAKSHWIDDNYESFSNLIIDMDAKNAARGE